MDNQNAASVYVGYFEANTMHSGDTSFPKTPHPDVKSAKNVPAMIRAESVDRTEKQTGGLGVWLGASSAGKNASNPRKINL